MVFLRSDYGGENIVCSCSDTEVVIEEVSSLAVQSTTKGWLMFMQGVFHYLEELDLLDVNDELLMFCLHYIFLPRINRDLEHKSVEPLTTEHKYTPHQLFISGLLNRQNSGTTETEDIFALDHDSGSTEENEESAAIQENENNHVAVPVTYSPLNNALTLQLQQLIDH